MNTRIATALMVFAFLLGLSSLAAAERALTRPPDQDPAWSATAVEHRGRVGLQLEVVCPAGGSLHTVWGNNPYTDDSSICTAAVHAGLITLTSGGHVLIEMRADRKAFKGNHRNGVTSNNYGPWESTFVFPQAALHLDGLPRPPPDPAATTWRTTATKLRGRLGQAFEFHCPPGGSPGSVWGSGPYTDDSSICTAAVHAKVISLEEGGLVWIEIQPGSAAYSACLRKGIPAQKWGAYPGGFIVVHGAGPCIDGIEQVDSQPLASWTTKANDLPGMPGQIHSLVCPPNGTPGPIYGSGPYTDDSSICTAAVHAGAIGLKAGGPVILQINPGEPAYPESLQYGIQSRPWRAWSRSFQIMVPER